MWDENKVEALALWKLSKLCNLPHRTLLEWNLFYSKNMAWPSSQNFRVEQNPLQTAFVCYGVTPTKVVNQLVDKYKILLSYRLFITYTCPIRTIAINLPFIKSTRWRLPFNSIYSKSLNFKRICSLLNFTKTWSWVLGSCNYLLQIRSLHMSGF